jgi:hypothetical protein
MDVTADHIARERLVHHADRIAASERTISDFRRAAQDMALVVEARFIKLEEPMIVIKKLLGVCALGILGILGTMLANAMVMHIR